MMLVAARGGNIPTRTLLDDQIFATTVAVADYLDPTSPLPPHDVFFNAIGDADLAGDALTAAGYLVVESPAPVINRPERVAGTGRVDVARRLSGIDGVKAPRVEVLPKAILAGSGAAATLAGRGYTFPLLLRSLGFHTGRHFRRVEDASDLAEAVTALPGRALAVIEYLDARGGDKLWRKYRAMMVNGRLYPLHLAISDNWKVHYFTAGMTDHPLHRDEEAKFLSDMAGTIGSRAMTALDVIQRALGLDYGGIDFGLDPDGAVLLFEANATMVINPPDQDPRWDYRRQSIQLVIDAVRLMFTERAGVTFVPPGANIR